MNRYGVIVVSAVVLASVPARADKATDDASAAVKGLALQLGHPDKLDGYASLGAVLVGAHAQRHGDYTMDGTAMQEVLGSDATGADVALGALSIAMSTDRGEAWFAMPIDVTVHVQGKPDAVRHLRYSGHARMYTGNEGGLAPQHGWKVDYMMFSAPVADAVLVATPDAKVDPKATSTAEDGDTLSPAVVSWFANGTIGKHAATRHALLLATGTAPTELATGDAAVQLASSWDTLHMTFQPFGGRTDQAKGTTVAEGTVLLPLKDKRYARLAVYVVAVKEANEWKWVSLQFASSAN